MAAKIDLDCWEYHLGFLYGATRALGATSEVTKSIDWMRDQTVIKHTAGSFTAGTVNGAGQTGNTLVTSAIKYPATTIAYPRASHTECVMHYRCLKSKSLMVKSFSSRELWKSRVLADRP